MPLPVMNFAGLQTANTGTPDLAQSLIEGIKAYNLPKMQREEYKAKQLANILAQITNQYAPGMAEANLAYEQQRAPNMEAQTRFANEQSKYYGPNIQSEIGLRNAQIPDIKSQIAERNARIPGIEAETKLKQFNLQNPLLSLTGDASQIGAIQYMQQHPELFGNKSSESGEKNLSDLAKQSFINNLQGKSARTDLTQQQASGYGYSKLPMQTRNMMVSQAGGMGIDPNEASAFFANGGTVSELAKENGFDPKKLPEPVYPATVADLTRIKLRQQANAELNVINPILTEALAPYSSRIAGYSPKQIAQAIKGDDPDAQAKFLAASGLTPEMSALRLKSMGGQVGIEAIREVTQKSMGNIKSYQSLVSPEVYKKANKYMEDWITLGVTRANSVGLNPQTMREENLMNSSKISNENVKTYNPKTRKIE